MQPVLQVQPVLSRESTGSPTWKQVASWTAFQMAFLNLEFPQHIP